MITDNSIEDDVQCWCFFMKNNYTQELDKILEQFKKNTSQIETQIKDTREELGIDDDLNESVTGEVFEKALKEISAEAAEKAAKEFADKGAKEAASYAAAMAARKAAMEAAEKAAKEAAERIAKETGERVSREVAEKAAKEAAERAAKTTFGSTLGKSAGDLVNKASGGVAWGAAKLGGGAAALGGGAAWGWNKLKETVGLNGINDKLNQNEIANFKNNPTQQSFKEKLRALGTIDPETGKPLLSIDDPSIGFFERLQMKAVATREKGGWPIEYMAAAIGAAYCLYKTKDWWTSKCSRIAQWFKSKKSIACMTFSSDGQPYEINFNVKTLKWELDYSEVGFLDTKSTPKSAELNGLMSTKTFKSFSDACYKYSYKYLNDDAFRYLTEMLKTTKIDKNISDMFELIGKNRKTILEKMKV